MNASRHIYHNSKHKFFDDLVIMLSAFGSMGITLEAFHKNGYTKAPLDPNYYFEFSGCSILKKFTWYPYTTFKCILDNNWPEEIVLHEGIVHEKNPAFRISSTPFKDIQSLYLQSSFMRYFETNRTKIEKIAGQDPNKWPEPWNFARVIRNAWAHKGKIHFKNLSALAVSWGNITYSPQHNDKKITFKDISIVELILLMEEMDISLN